MEPRNLTLLTDLYELTMMQGYFREKDANETVIFDAFYRSGFLLVFAGSCHEGLLRCGAIRVMARPLGRARFARVHDEHLQAVFDVGEANVGIEVEGQNLRIGVQLLQAFRYTAAYYVVGKAPEGL